MTQTPAPKPDPQAKPAAKAGRNLPKIGAAILGVIAAVALLALAVGRYGAITPQGRMFVEARASGLKLGRIGKLRIEGVGGDIWRDFTVRRLTISDEKGVWLQAQNLSVRWRALELFSRRFHAEAIRAEQLQVLRRPTLTPKTKSGAAPVSVDLDSFATRLVLEPAFSGARGDYDVAGSYEMARLGGQLGRFRVESRLHAGDFLSADFDLGRTDTLRLNAQAVEAAGGALAGSLGLDPKKPFALNAKLSGEISKGRFDLDARLGGTQPLKASGAWTPEGGSASGVAVLSASTLTAPYGLRFGEAPRFEISGAKAAGGFYDLKARIDADNLKLSARGLGDIGDRKLGPGGLTLDATVPVMSKILSTPALGRTTAKAVLTGQLLNWVLDGSVSTDRFELGGYTLARVSGPARLALKGGELSIKADLAGQGGAGAGSYAGLLGAQPKVTADISRLKDGRWLFRRVNAVGSGLTVDGSGARGLLGGLNFKGDATLTNLAAIRPDAKGRLTAKIDASQSRGGQPWRIALDGRGVDFASGLAEADRLLGPKPSLALRGALAAGGAVTLTSAKLDGAAASATGSGAIAPDKLALNIDWNAQGPFRAGPLEIAGAAKGTGAITGSPSEPALKLAADFESIDLPRLPLRQAHLDLTFRRGASGSDGDARLTAASEYGPARLGAAFGFAQGGLDLTNIDADAGGVQAKGALSLRRSRPSTADLTLAVGPGALLANGRISGTVRVADAPGGARARVDLSAENALLYTANLSIAAAKITADGPLANLPLSIQARGAARPGRWRVDLGGRLTDDASGQSLSLEGMGELGRARVSTREAAILRLTPGGRSARLRLAVGQGSADIDMATDTAGATLSAALAGVDISALNEDLDGQVDARVNLQGRGPSLTGGLTATVKGVRERGAPTAQSLDGQIAAQLESNQLRVSGAARTAQGLTANGEFTLPAQTSASPLRLAIDRTKPMAGRFVASGEVKPLWDLLIGGERSLSGKADVSLTLSGSISEPRAEGSASLARGRFEDGATGLTLTDVALTADLSQSGVDLRTASAGDGDGGRISGSGRFDLRKGAASSLTLDMTSFKLIDNQLGEATASGRTTLSRDADGRLKLTGALTVDRADLTAAAPIPSGVVALDVIERNRPPDLIGSYRPEPTGQAMILDVTLEAPRRIFVRGRGLDVELSLDAHLTGTTSQPLLGGTARVVRGDYDFAGKRFEFDNRGVVYLAARPELIRLDLTAVREDPTLTATVIVKGTAARPEITLSSSPSLPSDEVLSQVLFGASAAQLSPLEAAQLASALAAMSGGGGFDVIGNLRNLTRLDRIAFAGDAAGGMTVAGGKYITDDVYLEIIGGGREGPVAQVEWRVRRNLSVVSRLSSQNDGRLSVRWRRDF